ncbi:hypothetical protein PL10110_340070 [Planktothrix agardhii]|nr:hypothetical protein PL10110_340070 [Planktothrix agardhii]
MKSFPPVFPPPLAPRARAGAVPCYMGFCPVTLHIVIEKP